MNDADAEKAKSCSDWSLQDDLLSVYEAVGSDFETLRGASLFMTGATGFVGCWLLETLRYADEAAGLNVRVTILTRDPERFRRKVPHLAAWEALRVLVGDVNDFEFPKGEFTHLIHAATDASAELNENDPRAMFDTILRGTRRALDFAVDRKIRRVLYLSSGAVYGPQPWEMTHVSEDWDGAPDCTRPVNAYGEGKRAAEMLCAIHGKQFGLEISIARIFALLGPYLSLDIHFAAGNFIRDAMQGKTIVVKGDGRPCRSYLYASDLAAALWRLLARGPAGKAYNVGSDESVSIRELAERVAGLLGTRGYEILGQPDKGWNPGRYVPDTQHFTRDFGLGRTVSFDDAIRRTALWHGWKPWR